MDIQMVTPNGPAGADIDAAGVVAATRRWLERAVIGLGLCPFAAGVLEGGRVRFSVSRGRTAPALLADLCDELRLLRSSDPRICETTLLIHPRALGRFARYNEFLPVCDAALERLGLTGQLQIASFHPRYRFAGSAPQAIENYTNRAPYPMLHLLREASIERAVATLQDPADIYRRNILTMRALGHEGWRRLFAGDAAAPRM